MSLTAPPVEVLGNLADLEYSLDDGTTFTPLAKILDFDGFGKWKSKPILNTNLTSTAATKQPGLVDFGGVSIEIRYAADIIATVKGWMLARTMPMWRVTPDDYDTPSTAVFYAMVSEFDPATPIKLDEIIDSKITLEISGDIDFTAGS